MHTPDHPLNLDDALHPDYGGADPPQPPIPLGATALGEATEGTPPFVMRRLSLEAWSAYVRDYAFTWKLPSRLVLHHTWKPTATQWRGLESMRAMQRYYAGKGWTSSPHIFAAPDGIWLAAPLSRIGIHAGRGNGSLAEGWYSIGVEMVGDFDDVLPAGPVWRQTVAVLTGLRQRINRPMASILSFHRDYSTKSCPGHAVTRDWVLAQLHQPRPAEPPVIRSTDQSPIIGPPSGTAESAIVWFAARTKHYSPGAIAEIVGAYRRIGGEAGVDWFLALAQCAHETNNLRAALSARPVRNPAGIGINGDWMPGEPPAPGQSILDGPAPGFVWDSDRRQWRKALTFARWDPDAISAHLGRLLAYALPAGDGTPVQQALIAYALELRPLPQDYRGIARDGLAGLDGVWNADKTGYPAKVVAMANRMRGGE